MLIVSKLAKHENDPIRKLLYGGEERCLVE